MKLKNEKQLLFALRYTLPIFILFVSIIITAFIYFESTTNFEKVKKTTKERFLTEKKQFIKDQVDNIYDYIISEQNDTEEALKKSLISRVNEAHKIIINIYNQYKYTHTKEEILALVKAAIKDIRFNNNRGYFFVYDMKAVNLIHPLVPRLEGKDLINHQDTKGTFVLKESLELLSKHDESYQEWYWRKTKGDEKEYKKIGFVKNIYELGWFIGTGEYVEDFEADIKQKVLAQLDKFKFGENGYLVVIDKNDKYLSHAKKELIGKDVVQKLDEWNDTNVIEEVRKLSSIGGGFLKHKFSKPTRYEPLEKVSYVKAIPKWDWIISTGFYLDDIQEIINEQEEILNHRFNENLRNVLIVTLIIIIVLFAISFYMSSLFENKFKKYKQEAKHYLEENQKQYELLSQKSKLAAMGEMMENIAHQWRQPLSLIKTASTGVKFQKEMDMLEDKFLMESIDTIGNSATYLSDTIEDFRDFFRADKEKVSFTIASSFEKTFKLLSSQIKNKEITVIQKIDEVTILAYERELLQVLLNILNNAKDALEDIEEKKYIFIDVYEDENFATIKIKDNAKGINKEIISKVFDPYFTTKEDEKGTGLGLYMSKEIIERNILGSLEVQNSQYEYEGTLYTGATFIIKIPK